MTPIIIIILLAPVMQVNKLNIPNLLQHPSYTQISLVQDSNFSGSSMVSTSINQAANFTHYNQHTVNYIFAAMLTIFLLLV
jgi:hypothetical protein